MNGKSIALCWGEENGGFFVENTEDVLKINIGRLALIVWKNLDVDGALIYSAETIQKLRDEKAQMEADKEALVEELERLEEGR